MRCLPCHRAISDGLHGRRPMSDAMAMASACDTCRTLAAKQAAKAAVNKAVRRGELTRGRCAACGAHENIHGHHHDYSKPLDIEWLCAKCHHRLHAFLEAS